jgi:hypothetical protein
MNGRELTDQVKGVALEQGAALAVAVPGFIPLKMEAPDT